MSVQTRKMKTVILSVVFSLFIGHASALQEWIEQPAYSEVNPGGSVVLACRVAGKRGTCSWERDNSPVGLYAGKYEWAGDSETGDCSLRIIEAEFAYDNGDWVCQVTASTFKDRDVLISEPVRLVVRTPPTSVHLSVPGEQQPLHGPLAGTSGSEISVECVSVGGNPPPQLIWYLGDTRWEGEGERLEEKEGKLTSIVQLPVTREDHGRLVKCEVRHEALEHRLEASAALDIHYAPRLTSHKQSQSVSVSEGESTKLECNVEANPSPTYEWRRESTREVVGMDSVLQLDSVSRRMADTYVCRANNILGMSKPYTVEINVNYIPSVKSVGPQFHITRLTKEPVELTCEGEGHPAPTYTWIQTSQSTGLVAGQPVVRGHGRKLLIPEVAYSDQGNYVCEVSNSFNGEKHIARSEAVVLSVHGQPSLATPETSLYVSKGSEAKVEVRFCADPRPLVTWQLETDPDHETMLISKEADGSSLLQDSIDDDDSDSMDSATAAARVLDAGGSFDNGVIQVEDMEEDREAGEDCYVTRLRLEAPNEPASRNYVLRLENKHGEDRHTVHVRVGELVSSHTIIGGVVGGGVLTLILVVLALIFCCKRTCCNSTESAAKKMKQQDLERSV